MIIYLSILVFSIIYLGKVIYKNYQKGLPFEYGQNKTVYIMMILCLVIGQFLITSVIKRIIIFLVFLSLLLLFYTIIGYHNRVKHSGELFLFFQKEKKNKVIDSRKMVVYTELIITGDSLW